MKTLKMRVLAIVISIFYSSLSYSQHNNSVVREHLDEETYVVRLWNEDEIGGVGHISLETKKNYLSFWPTEPTIKSRLHDLKHGKPGIFYDYDGDSRYFGDGCKAFKLVKTSKENIVVIDEEIKRLGGYDKEKNEPRVGLKKVWKLLAQELYDTEKEAGSCASVVQQVVDKTAIAHNSVSAMVSAGGHVAAVCGLSAFGPEFLLGTCALNPVLGIGALAVTGVGILGSYIYGCQTNAHGLRLTNSDFEKGWVTGHTATPKSVYYLSYPGHETLYDSEKMIYREFFRNYKNESAEFLVKTGDLKDLKVKVEISSGRRGSSKRKV